MTARFTNLLWLTRYVYQLTLISSHIVESGSVLWNVC